jgi:hypothetical protein
VSAVSDAVRKVLDTSTATDPVDLAREVDALLTEEQRADAWLSLLANHVRVSISARRRAHPLVPVGRPARGARALRADGDDQNTPADHSGNAAHAAPVGGGHTSPRLAVAADWWRRALDGIYNVEGEWKRLADMSRDDVLAVAAHRRREADANAAVADRLERLADAMRRARVKTVAKLAEDAARRAWGEAA